MMALSDLVGTAKKQRMAKKECKILKKQAKALKKIEEKSDNSRIITAEERNKMEKLKNLAEETTAKFMDPWILTAEEQKRLEGIEEGKRRRKKKIKNKKLKETKELYDKNDRKNYDYEQLKNSL